MSFFWIPRPADKFKKRGGRLIGVKTREEQSFGSAFGPFFLRFVWVLRKPVCLRVGPPDEVSFCTEKVLILYCLCW